MTDTKPLQTATPPQLARNPFAPCRIASAESDMHGKCMRCGSRAGEPCPET